MGLVNTVKDKQDRGDLLSQPFINLQCLLKITTIMHLDILNLNGVIIGGKMQTIILMQIQWINHSLSSCDLLNILIRLLIQIFQIDNYLLVDVLWQY